MISLILGIAIGSLATLAAVVLLGAAQAYHDENGGGL